jgi:hypothetical protein
MSKKVRKLPETLVLDVAGSTLTFVFVPTIGRAPLDDLNTDLDLITKVQAQRLPAALRFGDNEVLRSVTDAVSTDFPGRRGTRKLMTVPLKNSRSEHGRHLLFFGLGQSQHYDGNIVCETFEALFQQALELGSESVTVPFVPNPMTKDCLSHKATAFKLKDVLRQVLEKHTGPVSLREVKLWCSGAAVRHIRQALQSEADSNNEGCHCEVHEPDEEATPS